MSKILNPLYSLLHNHKLKSLMVIYITILFMIWLFPYQDLSDWLSLKVAQGSGVYLRVKGLDISLIPFGVVTKEVTIDPPRMPTLKVGGAHASLGLGKMLSFKIGADVSLERLFRGDVDLSWAMGDKAKSGERFNEINVSAKNLSLDDLSDYLKNAGLMGLKLQGNLKFDSVAKFDPGFGDQPTMTASLELPNFVFPSQTIIVDFNGVPVPQQVPTVELGKVSLKNARLGEGVFEIPEMTIGDAKSEISGKIKGSMGLQLKKLPTGAVFPEISNVDLTMDLTVEKGFLERNQKSVIGGFLILIPDSFKQPVSRGTRLNFKLKAARMTDPPNFVAPTEKL